MTKTILLLAALSIPAALAAQTTRWQTFRQSISVNNVDTTFFAFRAGFLTRDAAPDSLMITPPGNVVIDDDAVVTMRKVAGTNSDSSISYCKPIITIDGVAYIVPNDSLFLFGASFAAPATPNTFGDGRLYAKSITGLATKRISGLAVITGRFDRAPSGSVTKYEWGLGTK